MPQPYTRSDAEAFLADATQGWARSSMFRFAIEAEGRLAGVIDLRRHGGGLGEIGFGLMAWARGRGLMTRAVRLTIEWAFDQAGLDIVHWLAQVGNWPSRRVAWAVGFRVDAVVPGLLEHRGARVDGWIAALRAGDPLRPVHPWLDPVQILGPDVNLREHREQDVARMVEGCRDDETRYWLGNLPADYDEQNARQKLRQIRAEQAGGKAVYWAVADPIDDRLLGEMAIFIRDPKNSHGEIGYWTHPDARGRGVTTAAARLAVRHALLPAEDGGLGLIRVLLRTGERNVASRRVAQKVGFTETGLDRRTDPRRDGTLGDDVRFDLLAEELPARR